MHWKAKTVVLFVVVSLAGAGVAIAAPGRVELELANDSHNSTLAAQQWYKIFTDLKVAGLRIRSLHPRDEVKVEITGSVAKPVYKVTGLLNDRNELSLPGGKFTLRDTKRVADWVKKMSEEGPDGASGIGAPFGLNEPQLKVIHRELRPPVDFSTKGMSRAEVVASIRRKLSLPWVAAAGIDAALVENGLVQDELQGMSRGTALAAVLRPAGLALVPRSAQSGLELGVVPAKGRLEVWPVGFSAENKRQELLPVLFESINVEIEPNPLSEALEALAPRLEVPILLDYNALAYHKLDITKAQVSLPAAKLNYAIILRKLLAQCRLVNELRTDEAGKPFLWITSFQKPELPD